MRTNGTGTSSGFDRSRQLESDNQPRRRTKAPETEIPTFPTYEKVFDSTMRTVCRQSSDAKSCAGAYNVAARNARKSIEQKNVAAMAYSNMQGRSYRSNYGAYAAIEASSAVGIAATLPYVDGPVVQAQACAALCLSAVVTPAHAAFAYGGHKMAAETEKALQEVMPRQFNEALQKIAPDAAGYDRTARLVRAFDPGADVSKFDGQVRRRGGLRRRGEPGA